MSTNRRVHRQTVVLVQPHDTVLLVIKRDNWYMVQYRWISNYYTEWNKPDLKGVSTIWLHFIKLWKADSSIVIESRSMDSWGWSGWCRGTGESHQEPWGDHRIIFMSRLVKWHTLTLCNSFNVSYVSTQPFQKEILDLNYGLKL